MKTFNITPNGKLIWCESCQNVHIEFKNILFILNEEEFEKFRLYYIKLDGEHWEQLNRNSCYRKKIMVPVGHRNLTFMLDNKELYEFRELLNCTKASQTCKDILVENFDVESSMN